MSDVVVVAVITGGSTAAVGIAGLFFNLWSQAQERKQRLLERQEDNREWYGKTLFEKRLNALNTEYSWLMKLNRCSAELDDANDSSIASLNDCAREAREWYSNNVLYLFDTSPASSDFIGAVNAATARSNDFHKQLSDALKSHRRRADKVMSPGQS